MVRRGDGSARGGALSLVAEERREKAAQLSHCGARTDLIAPPRRPGHALVARGRSLPACLPASLPPCPPACLSASDAAPSSSRLVLPAAIFRVVN
eukprot:COSAG02_NODE_7548_length_2966_cov_5.574119_1_plen_94_part_10